MMNKNNKNKKRLRQSIKGHKRVWFAIFLCAVLASALAGCGGAGKEGDVLIGSPGEPVSEAEALSRTGTSSQAGTPTQTATPSRTGTAIQTDELFQTGVLSRTEAVSQDSAGEVCVYVCGAVEKPGIVMLPEGSRAADALEKAGGFAEDAAPEAVNLAEKVSDGEKLYFPTREESEDAAQQETFELSGLVNINTAGSSELCTLPGIGETRAADIIAYREANGAFRECSDIMRVPGIKESVYSRLSDKITVK